MIDFIIRKLHRTFMLWFPHKYFKYASKFFDLTPEKIESTWILFGNTDRFEIFPNDSKKGRGFVLVLDNRLALFFLQHGDAFRYNGMEMGKFKKGPPFRDTAK
ncbi:MAG: hypothetical protein ACOC6Q_02525 [Patescibacteria group bacterium]